MNKIQKMIMSFAAVALIVVGSAFTSTKVLKANVYKLSSDGQTYILDNTSGSTPSGSCQPQSAYEDCLISHDSYQVESFPADEIPAGSEESGTNGYWQ